MDSNTVKHIRPAASEDLVRIAEIEIFNYRLNFYPIFRNDWFYFEYLNTARKTEEYSHTVQDIWVYDDGVVKGFIMVAEGEIKKLFVEPVLQESGIGGSLLKYAVNRQKGRYLWALEKNTRAISFYARHGFRLTDKRKPEDGTNEFLVLMEKQL